MNLYKFLGVLVSLLFLNGCVRPTDRGQQYVNGVLPQILNQTGEIQSNSPRDFTEFSRQSELVTENSPSLSEQFQPLYQRLHEWIEESGEPETLSQYGIQAAQMSGGDQHGNVLFTGYFSPVVELRHHPDSHFRFPVYGMPDCADTCPTRAEIYSGALNGQGLELGYASTLFDPFIMEVQGSGFVHFGDDNTLEYFAYAGKNNKAYVSIGRVLIDRGEVPKEKMSLKSIRHWVMSHPEHEVRALLEQNPSYVFFAPKSAAPVTGSAGIPLLPMASLAGDRRIFPMGTPVLAEVPLLNADGSWSGTHELKLLIVLDTGGAVKDNHLDLYHGMGARAGTAAGHYRHFGRVWKLGLSGSATQSPWNVPVENQADN